MNTDQVSATEKLYKAPYIFLLIVESLLYKQYPEEGRWPLIESDKIIGIVELSLIVVVFRFSAIQI